MSEVNKNTNYSGFKCKMCGGDIEPIKNTNTGKCVYCKSVMTLPNLDNERIINLYNRANALRIDNEFDKSKEIYEKILELDNQQIEAHWGILLCKYGIEYVDDPKTKKKIPTCHRTTDYSIFTDYDFKTVKRESYGEALKLYEEEANKIDEIQKEILKISNKEKPYDIFICYKETDNNGNRTKDSVIAQDIYDKLTELGFKVFFSRITLEDKLGKEYEPYIYSALKTSKVMLVVGTKEEYFNAVWVKNEWNRFFKMMKNDKNKVLIPIYSEIPAYKIPEELSMLQAQSMDKIGAMQDLIRGIKKVIAEYKNLEKEYIDEETVAKVQKALEEAKSLGNNQYEVNIVKENLPIWYYGLCIATIAFYSIFKLLTLSIKFKSIYLIKYQEIFGFNNQFIVLEIVITIIICIYILCLFINRNAHKIAKKSGFILITLLIIRIFIYLSYAIIPTSITYTIILFAFDFITVIISHIITPSWNLNTSSKQIMNIEEKNKQLEKNNNIRKNFKRREKNKDNKLSKKSIIITCIILLSFGLYSGLSAYKYIFATRGNQRDENVTQIKVITDRLNIRSERDQRDNRKIVSMAFKNDIFTVLGTYEGYYNWSSNNENCEVWYKIKTSNNITGFVCSQNKFGKYVELLEK